MTIEQARGTKSTLSAAPQGVKAQNEAERSKHHHDLLYATTSWGVLSSLAITVGVVFFVCIIADAYDAPQWLIIPVFIAASALFVFISKKTCP